MLRVWGCSGVWVCDFVVGFTYGCDFVIVCMFVLFGFAVIILGFVLSVR